MNKTYNLQLLTKIFFLIVYKAIIRTIYGKKFVLGEIVRTFMVTIPMTFTPFIRRLLVTRKLFRTFIVPTPSQGWPLKSFWLVVVFWYGHKSKKNKYISISEHNPIQTLLASKTVYTKVWWYRGPFWCNLSPTWKW